MKKRLTEEWPLWVGLAGGLVILCRHAFGDLNIPAGSDWGVYLRAAEHVWYPQRDTTFPDWRTPAYAYLVGALGDDMGYVRAGQLLSSVAALLTVIAAAMAGRALADSWAGGLSALVCAAMVPVAHGAHWVNHYPLLGASSGLALATGVMACRKPHLLLGLVSGACAGASWALDLRGFAVVPAAGLLCALGCLVQDRSWRHRLSTPLFFLVAVGGMHIAATQLSERVGTRLMPLEQQVLNQRELTLDWNTWERGPQVDALRTTCADAQPELLDIRKLGSPCAKKMFEVNLGRLQAANSLPPSSTLILLLATLCLPAAWGWRSLAAQGVFFGVPIVVIGLGAAWVTYWDRYVLQFAVPIAALVPVACALTGSWLGKRAKRAEIGSKLGTLVTVGWLLLVWPMLTKDLVGAPTLRERIPGDLAQWAAERIGEEDTLVDCTGLGINQFLLPNRVPLVEFVNQPTGCTDYLRRTAADPGNVWVIARHMSGNDQQRGVERVIEPQALTELGWQQVEVYPDPPTELVIWEKR